MYNEDEDLWFPGKVTKVLKEPPANADQSAFRCTSLVYWAECVLRYVRFTGSARADGYHTGPWYNVILQDGEGISGVNHIHLRPHRVGCKDLEV